MTYNENQEYKVKFFTDSDGKSPVLKYLEKVNEKERAKISKYIEFLREHKGVLDEPYSKHIKGKIRELRVDFARNRHRIFYFAFLGKNIILLHAFLKHTAKTPFVEIKQAEENYHNAISNKEIYG
ncbi:MAG: type II toxin-antitoxin system RelE/ParE family toxin [Patescibacteria group bacterium]